MSEVGTKKHHPINGADYITSLPDCIMSRILSRLPTKDAVRTSILSPKWKDRWTTVYMVSLNDERKRDMDKFMNFIESVTSRVQNVQGFRLTCYGQYDLDRMAACFNEIFKSRAIETVELINEGNRGTFLPCSILKCPSLINLLVSMCCIIQRVPAENFFSKLQRLNLEKVGFYGESNSTDTLIFTFPVLVVCCFIECIWWNVNHIEIHAPKLTKFKSVTERAYYGTYAEPQNISVKIVGAKLEEFRLEGGILDLFILTETTVERAFVLVEPNDVTDYRTPDGWWGIQVRKLIRQFPGIKELKLSGSLCEAIGHVGVDLLPVPMYPMLEKLTIAHVLHDRESLHELLHASPRLKFLLYEDTFIDFALGNSGWDRDLKVPSCLVNHLEILKFHYFDCCQRYQLAEYIIKYGTVLKKVIVCTFSGYLWRENQIEEELSSLPRASDCLEIVVGESCSCEF